jgi:hypothetical protein
MVTDDKINQPVKLFISYSHDSPEHIERVLELSNSLRQDAGIDSEIDQYHTMLNWPLWMEQKIEWADYVLIVCTETYLRRWNAEEPPGKGLGAQWESLLTRQDLYEMGQKNEKFIPIAFDPSDLDFIPKPLRASTRVALGDDLSKISELVNVILDIPKAVKPPIRTSLAPIPCADGFFFDRSPRSSFNLGLHNDEETLHTNMFVVDYPETIYRAKAKVKKVETFIKKLRETWFELGNKPPVPSDFFFERGNISSFRNFNTPVWQELLKSKAITANGIISSDSQALSDSHSSKANFIKLLNRSLDHHCANIGTQYRIAYSKDMRCHLFIRIGESIDSASITTKALKVKGSRTVFQPIFKTNSNGGTDIQHWKHIAFRHRFVRYGETWYMTLTPFWAFTEDGRTKSSRWQKTSSFNMQKPEKNRAVLGHVAFWESILCGEPDLLEVDIRFRLRPAPKLSVSPSIHDKDWVKIADEKEKKDFKDEEAQLL